MKTIVYMILAKRLLGDTEHSCVDVCCVFICIEQYENYILEDRTGKRKREKIMEKIIPLKESQSFRINSLSVIFVFM